MNLLLYSILTLYPLPLIFYIIKHKHYLRCMPPFVALIGIYIFIILGSWGVINDAQLFSNAYYYSVLTVIITFYLFYLYVFGLGRKLYIDWSSISHANDERHIVITFLVMLWGFSFFMFYLYYSRHGLPAIFDVNLFEYVDLYDVREDKSTDLPEGSHWYSLAFKTIPAFIFCYTYIRKRLISSPGTKAIFYLNLPLVLFFSSLTMHKTPFAYLVLYALLIYIFTSPRSFNFKILFRYMILIIGSIIVFIRIYLLDRGLKDVFVALPEFFLRRVFEAYSKAHAYILVIFPDQHDFLNGSSFVNPGHIFPYDPVNLSQFLGFWVSGGLMNYPAPSFSQAYANFGIGGFILSLMIMFVQIILLQIIFKKCPKNHLFLSIYVLIVPLMIGYSNQPIDSVISILLVVFIMMIISIYYLCNNVVVAFFVSKPEGNTRQDWSAK